MLKISKTIRLCSFVLDGVIETSNKNESSQKIKYSSNKILDQLTDTRAVKRKKKEKLLKLADFATEQSSASQVSKSVNIPCAVRLKPCSTAAKLRAA